MRRFCLVLLLFMAAFTAATPIAATPVRPPAGPPPTPQSDRLKTTTPAAAPQNVTAIGQLGAEVDAVAVQGNYAFAAMGNNLVSLDVSDPTHPKEVGHLIVPDIIQRMALEGSYIYVIPKYGNTDRIINISNPALPVEISSFRTQGGQALDITVAGNYVYELDTNNLGIYDVSNPTAPTLVTNGPGGQRLVFSNNYLYIVQTHGLSIVDVTLPTQPVLVGGYQFTTPPDTGVQAVAVAGNDAYVAVSGQGIYVLDVSNSSAPVQIGFAPLNTFTHDEMVAGNFLYVVEGGPDINGVESDGLRVFDISQPSAPTQTGFLSTPGAYALTLAVESPYVYIANATNGLTVANVSDPHNPTKVGSFGTVGSTRAVAVMGNYAYIASTDGLHIVDTTNPSLPSETGRLAQGALDIAVASHYVYVTGSGSVNGVPVPFLHVIDVANPAAPVEVGTLSNSSISCDRVVIQDHYAYLNCGTILVIDISTPSAPHQVGVFTAGNYPGDLAIMGHYAYATQGYGSGSMQILDISNPTHPTLVGQSVLGAVTVAVQGNYAYVGYFYNGGFSQAVDIVNISNPAAPAVVGHYDYAVYGEYLTIAGNYLYISGTFASYQQPTPSNLQLVDVSNPTAPFGVGSYDLPGGVGFIGRVAVAGAYTYLPSDIGLYILQFVPPPPISVSGHVTMANGEPMAGVTITTSTGAQTVTDANGAYSFTNLPPTTITLTPSLPPYTFAPTSRTISSSATGQDFTILTVAVSTTLRPGTATTLTFTDTQGLPTTFTIPANAVLQTVVLIVTPTVTLGANGHVFAGHAFDLSVTSNGVVVPNFTFNAPITVSIHYSDADIRLVPNETQLYLLWEVNNVWQDATQSCTPPTSYTRDTANNVLSVPICRTGHFELVGPLSYSYSVELPLILH